jgi:hypothetical protein
MRIPKKWQRLKGIFRAANPWGDPNSRWPLGLLVVVSLGVFLLPLAIDVILAQFYRLPEWFRRSLGEAVYLALVAAGLQRLGRVQPRDSWPMPPAPAEVGMEKAADRWIPWALRLAVAALAVPIMKNPEGLGFADWDFVLDKFEALRRTILDWGQFPWWNPWCRGGFPLAAEPQIGAVSIATPLVLIWGTSIGLRLSAILCLLIAVEGAYRLAWLWFREPWSSAAASLIYGLNGGVIINTSQGYVIAMSYCSLPWLAGYAFRIGGRFSDGLRLGLWMAFALMNGIHYLSLYGAVLTTLIGIRAVRVQPPKHRVRLVVNLLAAVGTFLAVCGWRLATVFLVQQDDQREWVTTWDESLLALIRQLLDRPSPDWPEALPGPHHAIYIGLTCYVGPAVLLLGLVSLASGWRWWHSLTLVSFWLSIGSVHWYHPSYWMARWPFFASAHVVTRWRFVALLGLGLAVGSVLARWRGSARRIPGFLAVLLVWVIAVDFFWLAHQQFPLAFSVRPEPRLFPGPAVPHIANVREGLGFASVLRGYGVIRGYEPMLSYRRDAPTLRRAREDPDYRGEAWTARGEVQPVFWSPNRLIFQVAPRQEVSINQNPGSWWWVNGQPGFAGYRCAEPMVPFVARADDAGRLELQIHPRGLGLGMALHLVGIALFAAAWQGRLRPRGGFGRTIGSAPAPTDWAVLTGKQAPVTPARGRFTSLMNWPWYVLPSWPGWRGRPGFATRCRAGVPGPGKLTMQPGTRRAEVSGRGLQPTAFSPMLRHIKWR